MIELVIAILLPTAIGYAIIAGLRGYRWSSRRWQERQHRLAQEAGPAPGEPIERLGVRLRRLRAQLNETETSPDLPFKSVRVKAMRGAYVDVLSVACQRLDVPPPPGGDRVPLAEIYRAEAALRERGLDVREAVVP